MLKSFSSLMQFGHKIMKNKQLIKKNQGEIFLM